MPTPTFKAIETRYKGYRFRSRSEARFAVFLDALSIEWDYEPEGYDLGDDGLYLPDFWLPEKETWIEIKGARPDFAEQRKARSLAGLSGKPVYVFFGGFKEPTGSTNPFRVSSGMQALGFGALNRIRMNHPSPYPNVSFLWGECRTCNAVGIVGVGPTLKMNPRICDCAGPVGPSGKRLQPAYEAARSARFEHGENGTRH